MSDKTFVAVSPDGKEYNVPDTTENRQKIVDQGFTIDKSLSEKLVSGVGEAARGVAETYAAHPILKYNPINIGTQLISHGIANLAGAKTDE